MDKLYEQQQPQKIEAQSVPPLSAILGEDGKDEPLKMRLQASYL